ncbi:MAG TPA: PQQ-binding-like beta-propeller repeat protein [Bryobacteraceae bacterium]|nr:PQQ-binding-like beta-propeller repeat protein [Bryobacteraceae bacterium]
MRVFLLLVMFSGWMRGEDWPRFRGPNGSGVSTSKGLPAEFGPSRNLIWRVELPTGHSSPVVVGDRIYLTAVEQEKLYTLCLRKSDGKTLWKKECPRTRKDTLDKRNNAASPSVAADAKNVYVFFQEFGLLSYTRDGAERWKTPLGPFDNFYGMGASPVIAGDKIVLVCDQSHGSYALAVGAADGKRRWKQMRAEAVSGHSTPVLYRPKGGPLQVIAPGSFRMDAYQADTGEVLWHANGLASEMKSVPLVSGDVVYINGYNMPENDPGRRIAVPPFAEMQVHDTNKDQHLQKSELPEGRVKSFFPYLDLDHNGKLSEAEWRFFQQSMGAENALLAIKAGGAVLWKYHRAVPQLPSTLLYDGVLYMVSDGGILTTLDPATGRVHKQARLRTVTDRVFASPVAADGKVFLATQAGVVVVLRAGVEHEILAANDLGEEAYATPAISDRRIYVRTVQALYAFGAQ